jgi:ABC-type Fe3+-hydroxamate transport system substrate-binding protein
MKKLALLMSFAFVAGVAVAQEPKPAPEAAKAHAAHAAKNHDIQAEVVSVDMEKNTLTIKGETGDKTVPVEGKGIAALKTVKAGDKLTLTCKDNDKGEHQAVVDIKAAKKY